MIDNTDLIIQLREAGLIDEPRLQRGLQLAEQHELTLYDALIEYALVEEHDVVRIASRLLNVPSISLRNQEINLEVAHRIAASLAYRNRALPLRLIEEEEDGALLLLAMADPFDMLAMDEIAGHTGVHIRPILVGPSDLQATLHRVYKTHNDNDLSDHGLDHSPIPDFATSTVSDSPAENWARFFDTAQSAGIEEESSVISQEMRDRPPTDVFESLELEDMSAGNVSMGGILYDPFPPTKTTVQISLDDWELDSAFGQREKTATRGSLLLSDSIVEEEDNQKSTSQFSKSEAPVSQLARIQVKRIAVPIADAQKKVHREENDASALDSFGSEELMRATIRLLMKNGVFSLEELLASLKTE